MAKKQLSKHIWRHEVVCSCGCGFDAADIEFIEQIEECIAHFEKELGVEHLVVIFNSWCRCANHNAMVGGGKRSKHPLASATDFSIEKVHPDKVADYLDKKYPDSHGIGRYDTFTHFDRRRNKARWDNRGT